MNPIIAIDSVIPKWAAENNSTASPIAVADCSGDNGFTARMLQRDGVHPNELGDELIAKQIGPLLIQFVKDVLAERGTSVEETANKTSEAAAT
jgi:lysophospholipase L1-like esterase